MQEIIICKGLPASGKSTWAKKQCQQDHTYKRVNRDDLRNMLDAGDWSPENEKFIRTARNTLIRAALRKGFNVIVDDTNLRADNFDDVCSIVEQLNMDVRVQEKIFDTDPNTCIERDASRTVGKVTDKVINDMYNKYIKNNPNIWKPRTQVFVYKPTQYVQQDESLRRAIICDLDGTLALIGNRSPYDASKCDEDEINTPVQMILDSYLNGYDLTDILFVSGREDKYRIPTMHFLKKAGFIEEQYKLFMRKTGDFRKDSIVKKEIYDAEIKGKYYVELVLDDRDQVVALWRSLGLPTFQVNYGDF